MTTKIVILTVLLTSCNGLSIGVSENVNKSGARIGDAFPDWVPFKNKHGEELGQFVPVTKTVKKRLAHPMNFILRAVAEPDDEYYDKGQGGGDSEDNYENKDWSDLHRPAEAITKNENHTEISDIDSVVEILTNHPPNPIEDAINNANPIADAINNARLIHSEIMKVEPDEYEDEGRTTEIPKTEKNTTNTKKAKDVEDDMDYDEGSSEKQKSDPAEVVSESEAKKARILDAVDELKSRHAEESKSLSEKVEEEMYKEEFERNRQHPVIVRDKYESRKKYKKVVPDYDEYEDKNAYLEDKYKVIKLERSTQEPLKPATYKENNKHSGSGKLSVFKNPQFYMLYDDVDETTSVLPKTTNQKYSSRYVTTSLNNDDERISLIPEDSKEGEPTLFFPKKRKSRRRKIITSPNTNSENATKNLKHTPIDTTAADSRTDAIETAPSSTGNDVTSFEEIATATDVTVTGSDVGDSSSSADVIDLSPTSTDAADAVPASSDQKEEEKSEEKSDGDYHNEKGGGSEHHAEEEEEGEERGIKSYKGQHEDTKTAKGHHDKDNHLGKYEDHGGVDKHHNEESGHYGDHHHEEYGKKHAEYEESGKHSKGHNTKGSHDVHKKEEYEKKVEFFEEDGDSAEEERHGGFKREKGHSEGGRFKKGNLSAGHQYNTKGDSGHFEKGRHTNANKGYKQAAGHDSHGKHGGQYSSKVGKEGGKKWVYHHGSPARTANLVVIDRRADQFYHGPQYYG